MFESFLFHDQNVFGNLTCSFVPQETWCL